MADNTDAVDTLLKRAEQLKSERSSREALWRECERWVDPNQQGGFWRRTPGGQRDAHLTDNTAQLGIEAFVAAMDAMLMPEGEDVTQLQTTDPALNDVPAMQRWLRQASDRLHACRNAPHTGFQAQSSLRWRMLGIYGWGGFWTDEYVGRGLTYRAIHPSELFVDSDFRGVIDTVYRRFELSARQMEQMFHTDALGPKVTQALIDKKVDDKFNIVHVLRPNRQWEPGRVDAAGRFPIQSVYLCEEDRNFLSVGGYNSMPIAVSRYALSPHDSYGVGPAGSVIGSIKMLNVMSRDLLRATHLGLEPPVLMPSDGTITRMEMTPGAPIPGGMEGGRRQIEPYVTGSNVAYTKETFAEVRAVVQQAFLVHVFAILNEPIDRQTATEYLGRKREAMLLQAPNVGRQIAEALVPQVQREIDILMRAKQLPPPPPEFTEARARLKIEFDNPLTRAAKAADAHNFLAAFQGLEPLAQIDQSVLDVIDTDAAPRGLMLSLGARADWLRDPDQVAKVRQDRAQSQQGEQLATAAPAVSQAMLNIAKARSLQPAMP